jgi:hypothetical protein
MPKEPYRRQLATRFERRRRIVSEKRCLDPRGDTQLREEALHAESVGIPSCTLLHKDVLFLDEQDRCRVERALSC